MAAVRVLIRRYLLQALLLTHLSAIGNGGQCGNSVPPIAPTPIILQEVSSDGTTVVGQSYTLLDNNGVSDEGTTEAPSLVKTAAGKLHAGERRPLVPYPMTLGRYADSIPGEYVLFFSNNCFNGGSYTVNYAVSQGKPLEVPLITLSLHLIIAMSL